MDLTRRDFLKAGAVAAAGWHAGDVLAETEKRKRPIKKGIMWACVPGDVSVREKFNWIRDAGFEGLEIESGMSREEVLAARDATGLTIASVVDSIHWRTNLADANPAVRAKGLEGVRTALEDAKAYGATSVLLVPAVVNKNVSYDQAWNNSAREIHKVLPLAEKLGVFIAIENVWNNFLLSPLEAARYIDQFNATPMRWHFDVGNCVNYGWPEQWIRILGKRIHKLHIKEYSRQKRDAEGLWKGFAVEYLQGDNDWPAVMAALDETGYAGWGTAEPAWTPPGVSTPERLAQVSRKLDEIFAL